MTQLEICNHALLKVGADTITTLTEPTSSEDGTKRSIALCNTFFDQALEEILRLYPWNSCVKRATPTAATAPSFGYDNAFTVPADCVRIINVFDNANECVDGTQWVVEDGEILCNYDTIYLKYIATPSDPTGLDVLCTKALICNMAIKLAPALQLDSDWEGKLINELHNIILPSARSIDTFENKELLIEESQWLLGRGI